MMYGLNSDDVIIMFVTKLKNDYKLINDFKEKRISQKEFVDFFHNEFGLKENICDNIYYRLSTISKIK